MHKTLLPPLAAKGKDQPKQKPVTPQNKNDPSNTPTDIAELNTRLILLEQFCQELKEELRKKDKAHKTLSSTVEALEFRLEFLHTKLSTTRPDSSDTFISSTTTATTTEVYLPDHGYNQQSIHTPCSKFPYDMQLFNQRIKELNHIAGEGVAVIKVVDGTSRLKTPEKLVLSVYSNGIILQNGQLRPHNDPSVKLFMRDILDGYFPYELKDLYPDGVPFEVRDCHDEEYQGWKRATYIPFGGQGMSLIDSSTENVNDKVCEPEPNKPMTEATPKDSDKRYSISQPPHNPEPPSKSTSQHSTRRRTLTPKSVSTASKSQISAESSPEKPPTIHAAFNTGEILRIYSSPTILMKPVYLTTSNPSETKLEIQTSTSNMQNTIQLKITSFCNFEFGTTTLILTLPQSWIVSQFLSALNSYLSMSGILEWKLVVFLGMSNQNTLYSTQTFTSNSISGQPLHLALSVSIKDWGTRVASHLVNFK